MNQTPAAKVVALDTSQKRGIKTRVGVIDADVAKLKQRVAFVIAMGDNSEPLPLTKMARWDCVKLACRWWNSKGRHETKEYMIERGLNVRDRTTRSGIWEGLHWDDLAKHEKITVATQWYVQKYLHDQGILIEEDGTAYS